VGRIVFGYVADYYGRLLMVRVTMLLAGVATFIWGELTSFVALMLYSIFFGFLTGGFIGLRPVVAAALYNDERLATVVGVITTSAFLGRLLSPPIAGWLYLIQGNYEIPIIVAGLYFLIAAALVDVMCHDLDERDVNSTRFVRMVSTKTSRRLPTMASLLSIQRHTGSSQIIISSDLEESTHFSRQNASPPQLTIDRTNIDSNDDDDDISRISDKDKDKEILRPSPTAILGSRRGASNVSHDNNEKVKVSVSVPEEVERKTAANNNGSNRFVSSVKTATPNNNNNAYSYSRPRSPYLHLHASGSLDSGSRSGNDSRNGNENEDQEKSKPAPRLSQSVRSVSSRVSARVGSLRQGISRQVSIHFMKVQQAKHVSFIFLVIGLVVLLKNCVWDLTVGLCWSETGTGDNEEEMEKEVEEEEVGDGISRSIHDDNDLLSSASTVTTGNAGYSVVVGIDFVNSSETKQELSSNAPEEKAPDEDLVSM